MRCRSLKRQPLGQCQCLKGGFRQALVSLGGRVDPVPEEIALAGRSLVAGSGDVRKPQRCWIASDPLAQRMHVEPMDP